MTVKNIVLKGDPIRKEREAEESITPGELLELRSDGKVQKHSSEGENAVPIFAVEEDFLGEAIDESYDSGDRVQYAFFRPGDEVYAWLDDGSAEVNPGDFLMSKGDGTLTKFTAQEDTDGGTTGDIHPRRIVAIALENINPGDSDERIKVEVL